MAALCVQAIWMTRAHSISSRGLAPSMNAKLAFTAISQIPLFGSRAAAGVGARPTAEMIKPSRYGGTANRESCRWRRRQPRLQAPHQSQWFGPFGRPRLLHAIACSVTASFTNHGAIGQCARRRTAPRHTVDGQIAFGETHLFVGPGLCGLGPPRRFDLLRRCARELRVLSQRSFLDGEDYILYAILDFIVDNYTPVMEAIQAEVEEIEDSVLQAGAPVNVQRLYLLRRDLLRLRNAVVPLVEVCRRLEHAEADRNRRCHAAAVSRRHRSYTACSGRDRLAARSTGVRLRGEPDDRPGAADGHHPQAGGLGRHSCGADGDCRYRSRQVRRRGCTLPRSRRASSSAAGMAP